MSENNLVYINKLLVSSLYKDVDGNNVTEERNPIANREVWDDYLLIPDIPPLQTVFPGTIDGIVSGISDVLLTQLPGTNVFQNFAEFMDMVPGSYINSTGDKVYTPTLKDALGNIIPYNLTVWVPDGLHSTVTFTNGIPDGFVPPFTISYWRYIGTFPGTGAAISHNTLAGIQGGVPTQYYHIDQPNYIKLTSNISITTSKINIGKIFPDNNNLILGSGTTADNVTITTTNNTIIGNNSATNFNNGDNNVIIGINNSNTLTDGSDNIIIGKNLDIPAVTSDIIKIGNTTAIIDGNLNTGDLTLNHSTGTLYIIGTGGAQVQNGDLDLNSNDLQNVPNITNTGDINITNDAGKLIVIGTGGLQVQNGDLDLNNNSLINFIISAITGDLAGDLSLGFGLGTVSIIGANGLAVTTGDLDMNHNKIINVNEIDADIIKGSTSDDILMSAGTGMVKILGSGIQMNSSDILNADVVEAGGYI